MYEITKFISIVGIGSTILLDIWVFLSGKIFGIPGTDWGKVGCWLFGISEGRLVLDPNRALSPSLLAKITGWSFHYIIGMIYAALIVVFFGRSFIYSPTVLPVVIIGVITSTIAGLTILSPAMGGGFFASRAPNQLKSIIYVIIAHIVFAIGQYLFSNLSIIK